MAMLGVAGVTVIDCKVAALTVTLVLPEISPSVAVMVVLPTPAAAPLPEELRLTIPELALDQVTSAEISNVLLSE